MASLSELHRELKEWEGRLDKRKARREAQQKNRKKLERQLAGVRRRLHATGESIKRARRAVGRRRRRIHARENHGARAALAWCRSNLFVTENPPGSNRGGRITVWETRLGAWLVGAPWCGTYVGNALLAAGVKGVNSRIAAVSLIEDDARAGRAPYRGWSDSASSAKPGDLVVLFGRGVHVEIVRSVENGYLLTYGGNTSSGNAGSQSNGGGSFPRSRSFSVVHGIAHVRY